MQSFRSVQVYLPSADDIDGQLAKVLAPFLMDEDGKSYTYRYVGGNNSEGSFYLKKGAPDITPDTHRFENGTTNVALVSSVKWNESWRYSDVLTLDCKWLKPHTPGLSRAKQGEANTKWRNGYVDRFVKTAPKGAVVVAVWMESAKDADNFEFDMAFAWKTEGGGSPEFEEAVRLYADAVYTEFGERPLSPDRVHNGGRSGMSKDQVVRYIADVYTVVRRIEESYGKGRPVPLTDADGWYLSCERCGSTAVEYVLPDPEGGNLHRKMVCLDCGNRFEADDAGHVDAPVTMPILPEDKCPVVLVPRTVIDQMVGMYLRARGNDMPSAMLVFDYVSGRAGLVGGAVAATVAEADEFYDYPQFLDWADDAVRMAAHTCSPAFPVALPGLPDAVGLKQGFEDYEWTPNRRAAVLEIRQMIDPEVTFDAYDCDEAEEWWHSEKYLARMGEIDPAALAAYAAKWAPHAAEVFLTRAEIAASICDWVFWGVGDVPGWKCVYEGVGIAFDRYAGLFGLQPERRRVCATCGAPVDPEDVNAIIGPVETHHGTVQRRFCDAECRDLYLDTGAFAPSMEVA